MKKNRWPWMIGVLVSALLAGCAETAQSPAKAAREEPAPAGLQAQVPAPPAVQPEPMAVLKSMAEHLSGAGKFSVNITAGYDVVQDSGQKMEFGEAREVILDRPGRLRMQSRQSDGEHSLFIFDGTDISYFSGRDNVYATARVPGTVDDAVKYFVQTLRMRVPLALMYVSNLPEEIEQRVESASYVEYSIQYDVPCHHLAARTADTDLQLWVAAEGEPLPRRVVITYKHEPGEPQFWADFTNWNLNPSVSDALFVFAPPQGAEKISFLAELERADVATRRKGGTK